MEVGLLILCIVVSFKALVDAIVVRETVNGE